MCVRTPVVLRALALLLVGACRHEPPLLPGAYAPDSPPGVGSLVRLTFNAGADVSPAWLPDGSGFLYTRERMDRFDRDRCLALLPAQGGSIRREICERTPAADDSVNAFSSPALGAGGRLAYVRASAPLDVGRPLAPRYHELVVGTLAHPGEAAVLRVVPYAGPSGRQHQEISHLCWLADSVLLYVGQKVDYVAPCGTCPRDTLPTGLEIVRLDYRGAVPLLIMLPGSDQASSVAVVDPDTIYFTVNGDSRVFSLALSTDAVATVHDFSGGIARDVQVAGRKMVAVVGGAVSFTADPGTSPIQRDRGGALVLVDRITGAETLLAAPGFMFRHPALAPAGTHVVAEVVTGSATDLWLVAVP